MTDEAFEQLVGEAIDTIPERFLGLLDNVAVVIADNPTPDQLKKLKLNPGWTLFGLYEGVPQTGRSVNYSAVLPDKITIFRQPIEQAANNPTEIMQIVKDTVWHELAHHFGMDEHEVFKAEQKRKSTQ